MTATPLPKPLPNDHDIDIAHCVHPYTNLRRHAEIGPLIITEGRGVFVTDDAGKTYLEGMAGLWCASLGFSESRLADTAAAAMRRLPFYHGFGGKAAPPTIHLAERLIQLAPTPMSKVLFANSGSEANDTAIKLIWYYNNALDRPEKKKIIARTNAYHGVTIASGSLTGLAMVHDSFDLPMARVVHAGCPLHYRYGLPGEDEEVFADRLARELEAMILEEGAETIAAMFVEPVMGAGGVIVPPATYFEKIQPVLRRHDILLVVDEVICGFGRTGQYWGSQTFNIRPDIITCAKALSSGYIPISAVILSEPIAAALVEESGRKGIFGHGYTYSGHPVAASVALETLNIYEERNVFGHVREVAPVFQGRLAALADHPLVGHSRGIGLVGAIEITRDKDTKGKFDAASGVAAHVVKEAEAAGLIIRPLAGDVVAFSPPLIINEDEINLLFDRTAKALDNTWRWVCETRPA